jgi:alpha-ribazole phosphatase
MSGSIDLLRHGETGQRSYRGQLDDALTAAGWAQLRAAVEGREWDMIVSSTLQRCAAFARELSAARGLPLRLDPPPGAETFAAFHDRLGAALDDALAEAGGRRLLVITHGGAIRQLRCRVERRSYGDMAGIEVPHASLHRVRWPVAVAA